MYVSNIVIFLVVMLVLLLVILIIWLSSIAKSFFEDIILIKKQIFDYSNSSNVYRSTIKRYMDVFEGYVDGIVEAMESQTYKLVRMDKTFSSILKLISESEKIYVEDIELDEMDEEEIEEEELKRKLRRQRPKLIGKYKETEK